MNRIGRWRAAGLVALAVAVGGCDDGLADLNENPNDPINVGAEYLFPNAVEASVSRVIGSSLNMDLTGLWVQHYTEHLYTVEDRYEVSNSSIQAHWSSFYAGPMQDLQEVIEQARENDRPNTEAMGLVMKVWTGQVMTDLWGDIGYTEALRGREPDAGVTVSYDPQEQVYEALFSDLETALGLIDPAGLTIGSADIIYGGDMELWDRFANSLRMRMAMRMSEVAPGEAESRFTAAYNAGGFQSNDDSAILWYIANGINEHPIFSYVDGRDDHSVSQAMIETLQELDDPRLPVYAETNEEGEYWGAPPATMEDPGLEVVSRVGEFYASPASPGVLMSYGELLFLQAEAVERGWIGGDAGALYEAAIRANMEFNGIGDAEIEDYLSQPEVSYDGGDAGLEQIWLQKWIALFGQGPEAYAEWRRTGVPELTIGPDALNGGQIPVRLFYPASEESLNEAAVDEARARQGGATLNSPVWWDQ